MPKQLRVLLMRICRGSWERAEIAEFVANAYLLGDRRVGSITLGRMDQEPTTAARNNAVGVAREIGAHVLVQVDADMVPSMTFFGHAIDFLARNTGAVVIGSPYCGAAPDRRVQVMRPDREISRSVPPRYERDEAARKTGTQLVGCIGTGLLAANVAAFDLLEPPYFDYAYAPEDRERRNVAETEDFAFCRRFTAKGGRVYCAWDHWSLHAKTELVGKPCPK